MTNAFAGAANDDGIEATAPLPAVNTGSSRKTGQAFRVRPK